MANVAKFHAVLVRTFPVTHQDLVRRNSPERDLAAVDVTFSGEIETGVLDEERPQAVRRAEEPQ